MQISLLLSACGLWVALLQSSAPKAAAALLAMMVQRGLLGALLTFSGSALYAPHLLTTQAWGMSSLQDQQLAGLIMWVPAAGLYLFAAMFLLARWFRHAATRARKRVFLVKIFFVRVVLVFCPSFTTKLLYFISFSL